ncbi:MAG: hypothetical protein JWN24_378 [Phycisphaerales bacterium]|nr:hypothetical protein [Phycisphaerales bacterium]
MAQRRDNFEHTHQWLNATAYLLHAQSGYLEQQLRDAFPPGTAAVGIATAGGTTWLRGIQLDRSDAEYLLRDFSGFLRLSREQTLIGAFRALIDYMLDLFADILVQSPTSISAAIKDKVKNRRINASEFPGKLRAIALSLPADAERKYSLLRVTRNLLEHNDKKKDHEYIRLGGNGTAGELIEVDGECVRESLLFVRQTALDLEHRARQLGLIKD